MEIRLKLLTYKEVLKLNKLLLSEKEVDEVSIFVKSGIELIWEVYPDWSKSQSELASFLINAVKQSLPDEIRYLEEIGELQILDT